MPMIVRWPGVTRRATVCAHPVIIEDFFPTILEMARAGDARARQPIDGVSFVPLLNGTADRANDRPLFWHFPNHWGPKGPGIGPSSTVRKGDWKLIYYHADRSCELFNLAQDLGETRNLAAAEPKRVAELASLLRAHLESVGAQMPVDKRTGKPVPLPGA